MKNTEVVRKHYDRLCGILATKINEHIHLESGEVNGFSELVRQGIRKHIDLKTDNFDKLKFVVFEYFYYDMIEDKDDRCKCIYMQIYALVELVESEIKEQKREQEIEEGIKNFEFSYDVVKWFQNHRGGSLRELYESDIKLSKSEMKKQIEILWKNEYLYIREGYFKHVTLTDEVNIGITIKGQMLYEKLKEMKDNS